MGQNKLKILATKILANFLILAAVIAVFYFIGQTREAPQVQAGEEPKCGTTYNTCLSGTPEGYRYDGGNKCWTWQCVLGTPPLQSKVTCCPVCGNKIIDAGEDCEGSNLNGQTCQTQGYDGGTLSCDGDCFFNVNQCTRETCGNKKIDKPAEQCDNSTVDAIPPTDPLDGQTCQSLGFASGLLACDSADCIFNTRGCLPFVCGNNIKEGKEQCDGFDLGKPPATCESLGLGTGDLSCLPFECKYDTTKCSGTAGIGCQNKTLGLWSGFKNFTKSCCGEADGEILDKAPIDADLCVGGGLPPAVRMVLDGQGKLSAWTWSCGQSICKAYAKAHCATSLSEEANGSDCTPAVIFKSKAAFDAAVTANKGKYCAVGDFTAGGTCSRTWNVGYNKEWLCKGQAPLGKENLAHCIVGWAPVSKCGTINNKDYPVKATDDCSQSPFFQVENKPDNPELCDSASGSVVVPGSKKYKPDDPWFSPFDKNYLNRKFTWECWSLFGSRHGEAVPCSVSLSGVCVSQEGKCGNDVNGHYVIPSDNAPGKSLCLLGQSKDLTFNTATFTWTWVCSAGGQDTDCSATVEAACGPANGGDYDTEAKVRAAGPCARGRLFADKIDDDGDTWRWICESTIDPRAYVVCKASTTRCGHAGGRAFLPPTFDAKKGNDGFLCASGTTAQGLSGPTYNDNFKRSDWTWKCGSRDCHATKLECGFGDNNTYHIERDFNVKRQAWPSFLCSGGTVTGWQDTTSGWSWGCAGADNDTVSGCTANKYRCGTAHGQSMTWDKFNELFGVTSGPACDGYSANSELTCSGGGVAICRPGSYPNWYCQTPSPNAGYFIAWCSSKLLACGTANNNWYYQTTLDGNKGKDNGFLCYKGATNGTISYSKDSHDIINRADWVCSGSGSETISCGAGVIKCGYGSNQTFSAKDGFYNDCSRDNGSTCLCTNTNMKANPRLPIGRKGADDPYYTFSWECSGDSSYRLGCQATGN